MKLFYKKRDNGWSGGMIIVAAHNEEEAELVVLCSGEYDCYLSNHGNMSIWREIPNARIDCDEPMIIDEDSACE